MTTQLVPFSFESAAVRVITHEDGSWSVVAKDVAEALGYDWQPAVISHVPEEWKGIISNNTLGGVQELLTLTEEGLYFFLGRSKKPKALPFQKWIFGEVLPAIRKTGQYSLPETAPRTDPITGQFQRLLERAMLDAIPEIMQKMLDTWALARRLTPDFPAVDHLPDHLAVLEVILNEIAKRTYAYPYNLMEVNNKPCLIARTNQMMEHLFNTPHLRAFYFSLRSQSGRVLKRDLHNEGLIVRGRADPTIAEARLNHAVVIDVSRFQPGPGALRRRLQ